MPRFKDHCEFRANQRNVHGKRRDQFMNICRSSGTIQSRAAAYAAARDTQRTKLHETKLHKKVVAAQNKFDRSNAGLQKMLDNHKRRRSASKSLYDQRIQVYKNAASDRLAKVRLTADYRVNTHREKTREAYSKFVKRRKVSKAAKEQRRTKLADSHRSFRKSLKKRVADRRRSIKDGYLKYGQTLSDNLKKLDARNTAAANKRRSQVTKDKTALMRVQEEWTTAHSRAIGARRAHRNAERTVRSQRRVRRKNVFKPILSI